MRKTALHKRLRIAIDAIHAEMNYAQGKYGRGLSSEGYAGGFVQALYDVQLLLNDVEPNDGRHYWRPFPPDEEAGR